MPSVSTATVRGSVEDVDEPPVFERFTYIMEMKENAVVGSAAGSVSAMDPDIQHSPVRSASHFSVQLPLFISLIHTHTHRHTGTHSLTLMHTTMH